MIVVDLNLLIYATNADAPQHRRALGWWEEQLSGDEVIGLPWTVVLGFLRIVTHSRVMPAPLELEQALSVVDGWLRAPNVRLVEPTERHWPILRDLLAANGTAGNLTADAHLAALAIELGARLCSSDRDFARFARLQWFNPMAAPE